MQPVTTVSLELSEFAREAALGLSKPQRELPSKYLYDDLGSALFEAITRLPEYGLTRADERLLARHAGDIAGHFEKTPLVAELGSGSGKKTRWVLEALDGAGLRYYPIDTSGAALEQCQKELSSDRVAVVGLEKGYLDGLREVVAQRPSGRPLLVLFVGSTIGNFDRAAGEDFLREVRALLAPGDGLLLGADLVKPVPDLLAAYDDPTGVTAAFNLNLLGRLNRELGADFVLSRFRHEARFIPEHLRIEMHLVSTARQFVTLPAAGFSMKLEDGESIWTESCHKFRYTELPAIARRCGFRPRAQWIDDRWPFSENLWIV